MQFKFEELEYGRAPQMVAVNGAARLRPGRGWWIGPKGKGVDVAQVHDTEQQAYAKLFAASPKMLKALQEAEQALSDIINAADNGDPYSPAELLGFVDDYNLVHEAIKLALEGEAS